VTQFDPICEKCEELIQPYLDRELNESERIEAEGHLAGCGYCNKRYKFEETLRRYVRQACCNEEMSPELKAKLASLRTPLD
jgi:anti-sigma factor (TIGR02949 family)